MTEYDLVVAVVEMSRTPETNFSLDLSPEELRVLTIANTPGDLGEISNADFFYGLRLERRGLAAFEDKDGERWLVPTNRGREALRRATTKDPS